MTHDQAGALRECPFCGGVAKLSNAQCGLDGYPSSYRQPCCTNCDVRMEYMPAREAIAAWNRRAALASPAPAGGEGIRDTMRQAYMGLLVLRTMLKKQGLKLGVERTDQILSDMAKAMPELPGLSALR